MFFFIFSLGAESVFLRIGSVGTVMYCITKNSHFTTGKVWFMGFLKPFLQPHASLKEMVDIAPMSKVRSHESPNFAVHVCQQPVTDNLN